MPCYCFEREFCQELAYRQTVEDLVVFVSLFPAYESFQPATIDKNHMFIKRFKIKQEISKQEESYKVTFNGLSGVLGSWSRFCFKSFLRLSIIDSL